MSYTRYRIFNAGPLLTGLVGTIGYTIYNSNGTTATARTTAGIAELITGSGIYYATVTYADDFDGATVWDTGGSGPVYYGNHGQNDDTERYAERADTVLSSSHGSGLWTPKLATWVLVDGPTSAQGARSLRELATRAFELFSPNSEVPSEGQYLIRIEEAWRHLVDQCPGVYRQTVEIPLSLSVREFSLPLDCLEPVKNGITLSYLPRNISTLSRATGGVVTATTTTAHNLEDGMTVKIVDSTPAGSTIFDGSFDDINSTGNTTFTYQDSETTADTATGGTVEQSSDAVALTKKDRKDLTILPEDQATVGQPQYYYVGDGNTICIEPISDGGFPALAVEYQAEAPDPMPLDTRLPIPGLVEQYLMAYAAGKVGTLKIDLALLEFAEGIKRVRALFARRGAF